MKPLEPSTQNGWRLTLMFREYCSLCHKMLDALKPYQEAYGFGLDIVDVDNDPVLEEKYNELVPVLLDGDMEICHWFLDENKLRAYLETKAV
ncbi:glutaredoxin family protein [Neisseria sp. 74A18]|uniref:glutaredoxin family protein n=1 Tax=Neisseria sp. 74A18 TaxID=1696094 RepID=UPI0006CAEDD1|nr:glutaredoxin family protein [Neisseria sp. 74A18]KPN74464.1 glutaredoxin [Neisseria sp. 74A18]